MELLEVAKEAAAAGAKVGGTRHGHARVQQSACGGGVDGISLVHNGLLHKPWNCPYDPRIL